jgi:folate-binding protein YgfZ
MSGMAADYEHLTRGAGYALLDGWTVLGVRGRDRAGLLHNLCTNDVAGLAPGRGCEAFFTDGKGHVLAHAIVLCRQDEILLWATPGQAMRLAAHIEKYVIREDVTVHDMSQDVRLVALAGQECGRVLGDLIAQLDRPLAHVTRSEVDAVIAKCPWFGPSAFLWQCAASLAEMLAVALAGEGAVRCEAAALEAVRIECGTPYFGVDFDLTSLPQEVNRNDVAISFTKGCYLGQETVARIDALGHVNRLIVSVRLGGSEVPSAGTSLSAGGKEVGKVTSATWSPKLGAPLALATVRRGHHEPGTMLESTVGAAEVITGKCGTP